VILNDGIGVSGARVEQFGTDGFGGGFDSFGLDAGDGAYGDERSGAYDDKYGGAYGDEHGGRGGHGGHGGADGASAAEAAANHLLKSCNIGLI
jgi:hypothetical protein